jgi:hypothetical protein
VLGRQPCGKTTKRDDPRFSCNLRGTGLGFANLQVQEGKCGVRMEERRKGFLGVVRLGLQCIAWVLVAMKEVLMSQGTKDFVKSFREKVKAKAWIVRIGSNKDGRFLELAVYAEGGWRGFILFSEGKGGRGWNRMAKELGKVLVFLDTLFGSSPVGVFSGGEEGW